MAPCATCGGETGPGAKYCMWCGSAVSPTLPPSAMPAPPLPLSPRRKPDTVGLISLGMFLGILGVVIAANPGIVHQAWTWFWTLVARGNLSRPPDALIGSAVLLFSLGVGTGFATVVLRLRLEGNRRKAAGDALGAALGAALAGITYLYGIRAFNGGQAIAAVAVSFGLLILASILLAVRWKLIPMPLGPPPPQTAR